MRLVSSLYALQVLVLGMSVAITPWNMSSAAPVRADSGCFPVFGAPNLKAGVLVMGIVSVDPQASAQKLVWMARSARNLFAGSSSRLSSKRFHIFIFADRTAAQQFAGYQDPRRAAPLQERDYVALQALWPRTLIVYEFLPAHGKVKSHERVWYPQRAPQSWWKS